MDSFNFKFSQLPVSRRPIVDLLKIIHCSTIPGYMIYDIDMTWAEKTRAELLSRGFKITATAVLLKAIGIAQITHPASRTEILPLGRQVTYHDITAGFTVERIINNQPTVFLGEISSPHTKSLIEIARELKKYSTGSIDSIKQLKVQNFFSKLPWFIRIAILCFGQAFPRLRLTCQNATFGLTSLGKLGVKSLFSPCLCTSSFGIGSLEDRVVAKNKNISIQKTMTLSFNFNQKALDPENAARFVQEVQRLMEGGLQEYLDPCFNNEVSLTANDLIIAAS